MDVKRRGKDRDTEREREFYATVMPRPAMYNTNSTQCTENKRDKTETDKALATYLAIARSGTAVPGATANKQSRSVIDVMHVMGSIVGGNTVEVNGEDCNS
jgi:hypothetical protein